MKCKKCGCSMDKEDSLEDMFDVPEEDHDQEDASEDKELSAKQEVIDELIAALEDDNIKELPKGKKVSVSIISAGKAKPKDEEEEEDEDSFFF